MSKKPTCNTCKIYLKNPEGLFCLSQKLEYEIKKEYLDGREYYIAPVTLLKEGVHVGSAGPVFYSSEELSKFPQAWNGRPLPVYHPIDDEGGITANTPETIQTQSVGYLYNVIWEEGEKALKGEIWVDVNKAKKISDVILDILENGKPLEVSTGFFSEAVQVSDGIWNDEEYMLEAINIRPDHLALLPGEKGACSWEDGCGVRNSARRKPIIEITNQSANYRDVISALDTAINKRINREQVAWTWVEYVNNTHVIYQYENKDEVFSIYYKQEYQYDPVTGFATLVGTPVEVEKRISYVEKVITQNTSIQNRQGGKMNKRVKELVTNQVITEEEAGKLEGLSEDLLAKLMPEKVEQKQQELKPLEIKEMLKAHFANSGDFMELLPPDVRESVQHGLTMYNSLQADLRKTILENSKYTEEMLQNKSIQELEILAELAKPADYSGGANNKTVINKSIDPEEVLLPTGV